MSHSVQFSFLRVDEKCQLLLFFFFFSDGIAFVNFCMLCLLLFSVISLSDKQDNKTNLRKYPDTL